MATKNECKELYHGVEVKYKPSVFSDYGFIKASAKGTNDIIDYFSEMFFDKDVELSHQLVKAGAPDNDQGSLGAISLLVAHLVEKHTPKN